MRRPSTNGTQAQPRTAGLEVLLVDDDAGFLQELADGLSSAGLVPVIASSPVDGLAIVESRPSIGLVMADLVMPGMDGLEFLWILSRLTAPSSPPCIVMTGHASLDRAVAAMRVRAADLLTKPFAIEDALRAIARVVESPAGRRPGPAPEAAGPDGRERARAGLIRQSLLARMERERLLGPELLGDHAWTMILELYLAEISGVTMSTGNLVQASRAPASTALRRIDDLVERGLIERQRDPADGRRTMLKLNRALRGQLAALVDRLAERPGGLELT